MQGKNIHDSYKNRVEYHVVHLLNHYMPKGTTVLEIPETYQISVLNFNVEEDENPVHKYFMQSKEGCMLGKRMNVIFLELPKIRNLPDDIEKLAEAEIWGKFFTEGNKPDKKAFIVRASEICKGIECAMTELEFLSEEEAEWQREKSHMRYVLDVNTAKKEAEILGHQEGFSKGLEQG